MIGVPTTPEQRAYYAARARRRLDEFGDNFAGMEISKEQLMEQFQFFADVHTRHMLVSEDEEPAGSSPGSVSSSTSSRSSRRRASA